MNFFSSLSLCVDQAETKEKKKVNPGPTKCKRKKTRSEEIHFLVPHFQAQRMRMPGQVIKTNGRPAFLCVSLWLVEVGTKERKRNRFAPSMSKTELIGADASFFFPVPTFYILFLSLTGSHIIFIIADAFIIQMWDQDKDIKKENVVGTVI